MIKFLIILFLTLSVAGGAVHLIGKQPDGFLLAQSFEVVGSSSLEALIIPPKSWDLGSKLKEAEEILAKIPTRVGLVPIKYTEEVLTTFPTLSRRAVERSDPEKDIVLALLNKATGEIEPITVTKRGADLITPVDYEISITERPNGIRWNKWNTQWEAPEGYIVLKNSYPEETGEKERRTALDSKGRKITTYEPVIESFIYSPYTTELHTSEVVEAGRAHIKKIVNTALDLLAKRKVTSMAYPDKLVTDIEVFEPEFFEMLPIVEHTDMTEFTLNPVQASERVLVLIGANPDNAFAKTGSFAGALGWVQYTKKTYDAIRKLYPDASLDTDFKSGAPNHLNSMIAAILLYDYHLAQMIKSSGQDVAKDPRLVEYLTAAYNGGPTRISKSLYSSILKNSSDWTGELRDETKGYILKLRVLQDLHFMD